MNSDINVLFSKYGIQAPKGQQVQNIKTNLNHNQQQNQQQTDTQQAGVLTGMFQEFQADKQKKQVLTGLYQDFRSSQVLKNQNGDSQKVIEVDYDNSRKSFDVKKSQESRTRQPKVPNILRDKKGFLRKSQRLSEKEQQETDQGPVTQQTLENAQIKDYIAKSKFNNQSTDQAQANQYVNHQRNREQEYPSQYSPLKSKQDSKKQSTKKKRSTRKKKSHTQSMSQYSMSRTFTTNRRSVQKSEQFKQLEEKNRDVAMLLYGGKEYRKLMGLNKKSRKQTNRLVNRLYAEGDFFQEEKEKLQDAYKKEEMKECHFKPQILEDEVVDDIVHLKKDRNWQQFLNDQNLHLENVKMKTLQLKQTIENVETSVPFTPQLCEESLLLIEGKRSTEPIYKRLYDLHQSNPLQKNVQQIINKTDSQFGDVYLTESKTVVDREGENSTFIPKIHEKSRQIVRDQPFDVILYKDAQRRQSKLKRNQKKKRTKMRTKKTLSAKSEQIYAQKFIDEFERSLTDIALFNSQYSKMGFNELCKVLNKTGFIRKLTDLESSSFIQERTLLFDMWLVLQGDKRFGVTKRNVLVFLFAILGLKFEIQKEDKQKQEREPEVENLEKTTMNPKILDAFKEYRENVQIEAQIGTFDQEGDFFLSQEDRALIHQTYEVFYITRMSAKNVRERYKKKAGPSYKPTTNENSNSIAGQFRGFMQEKISEYKTKNEPRYKYNKKAKRKFKQTKVKYLKGKVMKHVDLLIDYENVRKQKLAKRKEEQEKQQVQHCTFKPKTTLYQLEQQEEQNVNKELDTEGVFDVKKPFSMPAKSLGKHRAFELYSLAKPRAQRVDRDPDEIEYEKFCDECTFAPDLTSTKDRYDYASPKSFYVKRKGLSKAITRMRKGRHQRQQVKKYLQGRSDKTAKTLKDIKKSQSPTKKPKESENEPTAQSEQLVEFSPEKSKDVYQDPRNFYGIENTIQEEAEYDDQEDGQSPFEENNPISEKNEGDDDEPAPLLFVDVNLGKGKQERIIVKEGDNAEDLAQQFAEEHSLEDDMKQKLVELLNKQIHNLLSRIDEDIHSQQSYQQANTPPAQQ